MFGIILLRLPPFNTNAEWYDEPNSSDNSDGFKVRELVLAGHQFFGTATEGLGTAVETLFSAFSRPDGYIIGEEASGAIIAGLTYGEGTITTKKFWRRKYIGKDQALEWITVAMDLELCFLSIIWII